MKEIKTHFLIFLASIAIVFILIQNIYSLYAAGLFLICIFTLIILYHTFWIYRLSKWLDNRSIKNLPNGYGVWEKLFTQIYRTETKQKKSKQELFELLEQFKSAAGAMLDGVIAIDENAEILWSNKTAQKMLNIIPKNDYHRPITYIFRNSIFKEYIENDNYEETLKLTLQPSLLPLEIKVAFFGANQRIIVCRDLTKETENQNMRKEFVSNFSHEIKTPLTVILGFLETLEIQSNKNSSEKKMISMMNDQAYRMKNLIDDLLLLSQVESNQDINRSEKINVSSLLNNIKRELIKPSTKKQKFKYSIDSKLHIYAAKHEIESAFSNLINNAIRYTPIKGEISVQWNIINGLAIFEVTDSGIGIPEKDLKRISERFYRVDPDRSRETGGTGLGLAIVKNIIIQHQGEMKINSEMNVGSSFKLIFPKDRIAS